MKKNIIFFALFFISILNFKIVESKIKNSFKENLTVFLDSKSYFEKEISCFEKKMIKRNNKRKIADFFKKYIYGYFLKITFKVVLSFILYDFFINAFAVIFFCI